MTDVPVPGPDARRPPAGSNAASWPRIVGAGDSALLVELGPPESASIDAAVNRRVVALAGALGRAGVAGVRDVVPAFHVVAVHFDPLRVAFERLVSVVHELAALTGTAEEAETEPLVVPVWYGGEAGPDLDEVARQTRLEPGEVIALHTTPTYRVFMVGFTPGFPYLGCVDERLRVPRRSQPRTKVAAGSVGLAGAQTGIYPAETPGGWQIIGRTALRLFDPRRAEPCLLNAGCLVRFRSVAFEEFEALEGA